MTVITRRRLLASAGVVAVAGAGSLAALLTRPAASPIPVSSVPAATPTQRSQLLAQAAARERSLVFSIDVALTANPAMHPLLDNVRADHVAHAEALTAILGSASGEPVGSPTTNTSPTGAAGQAPNQTTLRSAEQAAQDDAGSASAALMGLDAVLLASISACEAGHVELLT